MRLDWEVVELRDICDVLDSRRIPITGRDRIPGEYPYYGASGILDYVNDYIFDEKLILIGEDGAKWGPGEKSAFIAEGKYWVNNHAHVIRPNRSRVLDNWIVYYLNFSDLTKYVTGLTVPKLNQAKMREISIPLPPLPEQQRIVAFLDQTFAAIDQAKASAEKNLQKTRELLETDLATTIFKLEEEYAKRKLGDVCQTGAGGTPLKSHKEYYEGGAIPWLLSGDVKQGEIFEATHFITELGLKNSSAKMFPVNTVLVAMYGATAGQVGILRCPSTTNQAVCGILPNDIFIPDFMYFLLLSKKQILIGQAVGNAQPNISQIKIKNTFIPIVPTHIQKKTVAHLTAFSIETNKLERIYQQKVGKLEELKKSIMQKAFNSELT